MFWLWIGVAVVVLIIIVLAIVLLMPGQAAPPAPMQPSGYAPPAPTSSYVPPSSVPTSSYVPPAPLPAPAPAPVQSTAPQGASSPMVTGCYKLDGNDTVYYVDKTGRICKLTGPDQYKVRCGPLWSAHKTVTAGQLFSSGTSQTTIPRCT